MVGTGWCQMAKVRNLCARLIDPVEIKINPCFVGDGRQMQNRIGGAAESHIEAQGIAEGLFGHDLIRGQLFLDQLDDTHARLFGKADSRTVHSGNGAVSRERHTDDLGNAVHGVGRKHAGTGTAAGAGIAFHVIESGVVDLPCLVCTYRLKDGVEVEVMGDTAHLSGEHRAAGDDHRRQIQSAGCHQHAGDNLITVGDEDHAVKAMGNRHGFAAVRDQLTGGQGILHTHMAHGDAVAHADRREFHRNTTGHANAILDRLSDVFEVIMSRNAFRLGGNNAD